MPTPQSAVVQRPQGLEIADVGVTYPGGVAALFGVSLNLAPGSFHAILGPSGCGKSTLLKTIARTVPVSTGSISRPGDGSFAYVPQGNSCFPWLRAEENVAYGLGLRGVSRGERTRRAFVGPFGLLGDRRHAVVDGAGEPLSARRAHALLGFAAHCEEHESGEGSACAAQDR